MDESVIRISDLRHAASSIRIFQKSNGDLIDKPASGCVTLSKVVWKMTEYEIDRRRVR